jgi:alanyl-tRNA synthetase
MDDRLYYKDSYLRTCSARILKKRNDERGLWLQFEKNIFYPGGGGQAPDKGSIGNSNLVEILEEDGIIWHRIMSGQLPANADEVQVKIDWSLRYRNMQQHTGQHLLSHVLWNAGLKTVSVHLGESYTMIEVDGLLPDDLLPEKIENEANCLIRKALPVKSYFVSQEDVNNLPLRKLPGEREKLRIVEIEGMDYSACGGTHVKNTAEIGLIKYTGMEKIRGHARLRFLIGKTAYAYFKQLHTTSAQLKDTLQTGPEQYAFRVVKMQEEISMLKKETARLKKYYQRYLTDQLLRRQNNEENIIVEHLSDVDFEDIRESAKSLAAEYGKISFIYGAGRFCLCSPDDNAFNASGFLREYGKRLSLKGGGPPGFMQGVYEELDTVYLEKVLKEYKR